MGDIADDLIDSYIGEPGAFGYGGGRRGRWRSRPAPKCNHCGSTDVEWVQTGRGWRLFSSDGGPHVCKPTAESCGFEDETGS